MLPKIIIAQFLNFSNCPNLAESSCGTRCSLISKFSEMPKMKVVKKKKKNNYPTAQISPGICLLVSGVF